MSGLPELVGFYEGSCSVKFPSLKELNISNCHKMKGFINNEDALFFNGQVEFSILESMCLNDLKCLTMIWHYQHFKKSFGNLKSLAVLYCHKLKTVFPSIDMLETTLEEIEIIACNSVQVVFEIGELNVVDSSSQGRVDHVQLKRLGIVELPNLKHVWKFKDPRGMISFRNLESVNVYRCPNIKHVFPESIAINLLQLQELHLYADHGMEEIVTSKLGASDPGEVVKFEFPRLTSLKLRELSSLNCFYPGKHLIVWPMLKKFHFVRSVVSAKKKRQTDDGLGGGKLDFPMDLPLLPLKQIIHRLRKLALSEKDIIMISQRQFKGDPFSNIKHLSIYNYISSSSVVFPIHFLEKLYSLEKLNVVNGLFIELFPSKGGHVEKFSKIKKLKLSQLPILKHIWSQGSSNPLPNLEDLEVSHCENLISFSASSESYSFWGSLTTLRVSSCKKMINLFTPSTARNLTQLQAMTIAFCNGLTEVVGSEEEADGKQEVVFQKLRYLKLQGLTRMASFCSGKNVKLEFPSLKKVIVEQCPKLKTLCEGELNTPELDEVVSNELENNSRWSSDLNTTLHNMYTKEVGYVGLTNLELSAFPEMIKNWHSENPHQKLDFVRIEQLELCNCNNLSYLLTTSMALKLESLKKLVVENCGEIEQVIKGSEKAQEDDQVMIITFPLLEWIELKGCSNLTSFYVGSDNGLNFPALYNLGTEDCPKMATFAHFTSLDDHFLLGEESQDQAFFGNKVVVPRISILILGDMPRMKKIWEDDELDAESFCLLHTFVVRFCSNLSNIFPFGMLERIQRLKRVRIFDCGLLGEIVESQPARGSDQELLLFPELNALHLSNLPMLKRFCSGNSREISSAHSSTSDKEEAPLFDAKVSFPNLEILEIGMMKSLNKIWDAEVDAHSFCKLNQLIVVDCEKLENIFPSSMLENDRLQSFGILQISNCSSIKDIFEPQSSSRRHIVGASEETIIKIALPSLMEVKLKELPQLQCFSPQMYSIECPLLTSLEVVRCNQVKIFASEYSDKENQQQFRPLFCVNKATFSSIEELKLEHNGLMEEIWHGQNNQVKDGIVFSKLKSLKLNQLPKLSSFCSSNRKFVFPTLKDVIVIGCPRMELFSKQESLTPNVPSVKWMANEDEDHQGIWKGDLNATIQEMFTQKVGYSTLEELNLSEYKELIPIWNQNPGGFKMLTHLEVCNLDNLRYALTPSMALSLDQLKEFRVVNCEALEQIIADIGEGSQETMLPPKLELLELIDLPILTSFCSGNSFEFPSLAILKISKCPLLKTFISSNTSQDLTVSSGKVDALFDAKVAFPMLKLLIIEMMENLEKIWDGQLDANSFCQLDWISVEACNKLRYFFPLSMLERLQRLNVLHIWNCDSLEEIFCPHRQSQSVMETPIKLVFSNLAYMYLHTLPGLKCFFPHIHTVECPSMKVLWVKRCDKIQILASEFQTLAQSTKEDNQLEISPKCSLFWVTKATFLALKELWLEETKSMEEIWHGQHPRDYFPELQVIKLKDFPEQSVESQSFFFQSLPKLDKLFVDDEIKALS